MPNIRRVLRLAGTGEVWWCSFCFSFSCEAVEMQADGRKMFGDFLFHLFCFFQEEGKFKQPISEMKLG